MVQPHQLKGIAAGGRFPVQGEPRAASAIDIHQVIGFVVNPDQPLLPIRDGLAIVLRLLRASGRPEHLVAPRGAFQQTMGGRSAQMIRISLSGSAMCVPETSANKYALNVRFMHAETVTRPGQVEVDVSFELTFCNL